MADVKLSNGKEIAFDVSDLTLAEYRQVANSGWADSDCDEIIARCSGLKVADLQALLFDDYRQLTIAFLKRAQQPADPN